MAITCKWKWYYYYRNYINFNFLLRTFTTFGSATSSTLGWWKKKTTIVSLLATSILHTTTSAKIISEIHTLTSAHRWLQMRGIFCIFCGIGGCQQECDRGRNCKTKKGELNRSYMDRSTLVALEMESLRERRYRLCGGRTDKLQERGLLPQADRQLRQWAFLRMLKTSTASMQPPLLYSRYSLTNKGSWMDNNY